MSKIQKVLIIDDDEINNFVCSKVIKKNKFAEEVKTLLSGREGLTYMNEILEKADGILPDLILLDINMPLMNGWDFLEEYQKLQPNFDKNPVLLMLSSSVYEEDIEKANQHPDVKDYITKPLNDKVLEEIYQKYFVHQT